MKIKINIKHKNKILLLHSTKLFKESANIFNGVLKINKIRILNSLLKVKGVNTATAYTLLSKVGISPFTLGKDLFKFETYLKTVFLKIVAQDSLVVGPMVARKRFLSIRKLKNNMSYRGFRHKNMLPVNGQKTYSNAKTRKKFKIW